MKQARLRAFSSTRRSHQDYDFRHISFRLPATNFRLVIHLHLSWHKSATGNRQSKMNLGPSSPQPSAAAQESFVVSHDQLGFNLRHRIHGHADENQ